MTENIRQRAFQIGVEEEAGVINAFLLPADGQRNADMEVIVASVNGRLYHAGFGVPEAFEYFLKVLGRAMVAGVQGEAMAATAQYEKTEGNENHERQEG